MAVALLEVLLVVGSLVCFLVARPEQPYFRRRFKEPEVIEAILSKAVSKGRCLRPEDRLQPSPVSLPSRSLSTSSRPIVALLFIENDGDLLATSF